MEKTEYNNADLNELFNFSYNFDLLKGIIETLLKNQNNLQKQVDSMKEERHEFQVLKFELKNTKEELRKLNQIVQPTEEEDEEEKIRIKEESSELSIKGEKTKSNVETTNDFGFGKVKTFDQLKFKLLEFRKEFEKAKNGLKEHKENMNIINNKFNKLIGDTIESEGNPPLNDRLKEIEKKVNFLLGDLTLEDIEDVNKYREGKKEEEQRKIMNIQEMNRKITKLEYNKVDSSVFDTKNDRMNTKIEETKTKLNELIYNLYGYTGDQYDIDKNTKFVKEDDFDKYKLTVANEIEKIWTEIYNIKEKNDAMVEKTKDGCTTKDIEDNNNYVFQKMEEHLDELNKKFVLKNENSAALKNLEDQFKRIILLLATKVDHENDNWLIAKKPINGYSCAACESFIGDLKEEKNDKYINWKKMPMREREKEKEQEKEKIYRLGNGYSHVLKMVGVDNNKNVSLNPNSNKDMKILFPGNFENNKMKEGVDIQIRKTTFSDRVKSAHSKESKEKAIDLIRSKNYEKKLPKIKGSMSSDDFDKIIENPNPSLNLKENVISPKIIKIMKKTHSKFNV
jgi:hypothetical protein